MRPILVGQYQLNVAVDLAATALFAVTGALAAIRKRYDAVGVLVLALVTGLGGGLLRDGLFLQNGPPLAVSDARYLVAVLAGAGVGAFFARHLHRLRLVFVLADALALGLYAVVGAEKSLTAGLPILAATLVGVVNAVGGGLLRDVLVREEPLIFKPGEFYAVAALGGVVVFLALATQAHLSAHRAAAAGIAVAFCLRLLSIRLGWRTGALAGDDEHTGP